MPKKSTPILYYAPAIGWGILILYFSLLPGPKVPDILKSIEDFYLHFFIYFVFSFLISLASVQFSKKQISLKALGSAIILSFVLGGVIELVQEYYILNRTGGWDDVWANTSGAILASLTLRLTLK